MNLNEVFQFLMSAVRTFDRFYLCIDALDACDENERMFLHPLIGKLVNQTERGLARIFITGRPHSMDQLLSRSFNIPLILTELKANSEDIRRYVSEKLNEEYYYSDMNDYFKMRSPES